MIKRWMLDEAIDRTLLNAPFLTFTALYMKLKKNLLYNFVIQILCKSLSRPDNLIKAANRKITSPGGNSIEQACRVLLNPIFSNCQSNPNPLQIYD